MIRAMPILLKQNPDTTLVIVGNGPDLLSCQSLAKQLGVHESVLFTGQRDDIPDILAAIVVLAMPSLNPDSAIEKSWWRKLNQSLPGQQFAHNFDDRWFQYLLMALASAVIVHVLRRDFRKDKK